MASGSRPKVRIHLLVNVHAHVRFRQFLVRIQSQFRWHRMCADAWFASCSEGHCDPEKNDIKTKEKNAEKNRKAKEPVTSAEEEEDERMKVKKAALKRTESVKAAALEHGHDSRTRIYL